MTIAILARDENREFQSRMGQRVKTAWRMEVNLCGGTESVF